MAGWGALRKRGASSEQALSKSGWRESRWCVSSKVTFIGASNVLQTVPVLGRSSRRELSLRSVSSFWRKRAVESMTWEKIGRKLGLVSPTMIVCFKEAPPKETLG